MLILITFFCAISFHDNFASEVKAAKTIYVPSNYSTIQEAIDNANSGDTIHVWAGTYNENVMVDKTLTLIGNGSANTTIDGGKSGSIVTIIAHWINISGFKIQNSGNRMFPYYDSGINIQYMENITISNNNLTNNNFGIRLYNCKNVQMYKNTCYSNILNGFHVINSNYCNFENNTCNFSKQACGIVLSGSKYNYVLNNTCSLNALYGIHLYTSEFNDIINNTCDGNTLGFYLYNSNSILIENNSGKNNNEYYGLLGTECKFLKIKNNTFIFNKIGIAFQTCSGSEIIENNCNYNENGIGLYVASVSNNVSNRIIQRTKIIGQV